MEEGASLISIEAAQIPRQLPKSVPHRGEHLYEVMTLTLRDWRDLRQRTGHNLSPKRLRQAFRTLELSGKARTRQRTATSSGLGEEPELERLASITTPDQDIRILLLDPRQPGLLGLQHVLIKVTNPGQFEDSASTDNMKSLCLCHGIRQERGLCLVLVVTLEVGH